jgi:hypothetical protein
VLTTFSGKGAVVAAHHMSTLDLEIYQAERRDSHESRGENGEVVLIITVFVQSDRALDRAQGYLGIGLSTTI